VEKAVLAILQTQQMLTTNNVKTILILIALTTFLQISLVLIAIATDTSQVTKTLVDITAKRTQSPHTIATVVMEHNNTLWLLKAPTFLSTESTEPVEASASAQALVGTKKLNKFNS